MREQFGVLNVAKIIAGDRKVMIAKPYEYEVEIRGFGLARLKEAGSAIVEPEARTEHFYWPSTEEEAKRSLVSDGPDGWASKEAVQAVEQAAIDAVAPLGAGSAIVLWRAEPQWLSERSFERGTMEHRFFLRGWFIWEDEPEPSLEQSNLVERVAAAIHQRISDELSKVDRPNWGPWLGADEGSKTIYRSAARAAMEAMRDPTQNMVDAAADRDGTETAKIVWREMIESALGDF